MILGEIVGHIGISQHPLKGLKEKKLDLDLAPLLMKNIEEPDYIKNL